MAYPRSHDMFPLPAKADCRYRHVRDAKVDGEDAKKFARLAPPSDLAYLILGQSSRVMPFASDEFFGVKAGIMVVPSQKRPWLRPRHMPVPSRPAFGMRARPGSIAVHVHSSALRDHIGRVVRNGSNEQVVGSDTGRSVAAMKHAGRLWGNRAECQNPCHSMASLGAAFEHEASVPTSVSIGRPDPAIGYACDVRNGGAVLVDLRPETGNRAIVNLSHRRVSPNPEIPMVRDGWALQRPSVPCAYSTTGAL